MCLFWGQNSGQKHPDLLLEVEKMHGKRLPIIQSTCLCCSLLQVRPLDLQLLIGRMKLVWMFVLLDVHIYQKAFFDVKVFNSNVSSYYGTQISSLYRRFEWEKQRKYEQCYREMKVGTLVFSTFGDMDHASIGFYKRLAFLVSLKWGVPYSLVMSWLCCKLVLLCYVQQLCVWEELDHIRGVVLPFGAPDFALAEGQVAFAQWSIFILSCLSSTSLTSKS